MPDTTQGLTPEEVRTLRAARNCTDMAGLPIMSSEAATVMALEKLGLIRIIGEHQNRLCILPLGRDALKSVEDAEAAGFIAANERQDAYYRSVGGR